MRWVSLPLNAHSIRIVIRLHRAYIDGIEPSQSLGDVPLPLSPFGVLVYLFDFLRLRVFKLASLSLTCFDSQSLQS